MTPAVGSVVEGMPNNRSWRFVAQQAVAFDDVGRLIRFIHDDDAAGQHVLAQRAYDVVLVDRGDDEACVEVHLLVGEHAEVDFADREVDGVGDQQLGGVAVRGESDHLVVPQPAASAAASQAAQGASFASVMAWNLPPLGIERRRPWRSGPGKGGEV